MLLVEDHEVLAYGLTRLLELEDDLDVVATTGSGDRALALIASHEPDVIVLDRRLEDGVDSIDLIPEMRRLAPNARVLMLSGSLDDRTVTRALEAGCAGYIVKGQSASEIVAGVVAVARGEMMFAPSVMPRVMRLLRPQDARTGELSAREIEVLQLLADGSTTEQIAEALFLSANTVRNHVHSVIKKLGAHSRLEAVSIGIKQGLIEIA